jgi:hypothetical protein
MASARDALDNATEAIASHDATRMRRALLQLKGALGEIRFAQLVAAPNEGNTSSARLDALERRIQAAIERLKEIT